MIFIGSVLLLVLVSFGFKISSKSELRNHYWPAIGLKILSGLCLGLIYTYYYSGGDTWSLFVNAQKISAIGFTNTESFVSVFINSNYDLVKGFSYVNEPRSALMAKILSILLPICGGNYWLLSAYCSVFSFWGLWKLSNSLINLNYSKEAIVIAMFYFPSIVFWSSGIIKEAFLMGLLGHLVAIVVTVYRKQKISLWQLTFSIICWWLLFSIKYYYGATIAVAIILLFYFNWISQFSINKFAKVSISIIVCLLIIFGFSSSHPNLGISNILSVIVNNHYEFVRISDNENLVQLYEFKPTIWSFIVNAPISLISGLYFPLFQGKGVFNFIIILENLVLVILTFFMLKSLFYEKNKKWSIITIIGIVYVAIMATLLPMAAPNIGTLVRYKVGYSPFFILLLIQSSSKVQAYINHINERFIISNRVKK